MLSLFPVACSKFGAVWFNAEVSATDVNTLISPALLATAANKHDINPPAAISAMRFANDVWIMHLSHEINFSYSITSSTATRSDCGTVRPSASAVFLLMTSSKSHYSPQRSGARGYWLITTGICDQ